MRPSLYFCRMNINKNYKTDSCLIYRCWKRISFFHSWGVPCSLHKILHCCLTFCLLILLMEMRFKPQTTPATERIFSTWCPTYKTTSYLTVIVLEWGYLWLITNALDCVSGVGGGSGWGRGADEWWMIFGLYVCLMSLNNLKKLYNIDFELNH